MASIRQLIKRSPAAYRTSLAVFKAAERTVIRTHMKEAWVYARLPLHRGAPAGRFLVFGQGRSGSSLLLDLLKCHPEIYSEAEIFHRRSAGRLVSPWRYVNGRAALSPGRVYGAKMKIYQMTDDQGIPDPGAFVHALLAEGWKFVFLRRSDLFRKVLSHEVAMARGQYLDREAPTDLSVRVDPARFLEVMRLRDQIGRDEEAIMEDVPHVDVVYERDLRDQACQQDTCDRIFESLGLDPVPVGTDLVRTGRKSASSYIQNYHDLIAAVRSSEYARYAPAD